MTPLELRGSEGRTRATLHDSQDRVGQAAPYITQARRVWYYGNGEFEQWTDRGVSGAKPMAGWEELKSVNHADPVIEIEVRFGLRFEAIVRIDTEDEAGNPEQYFYLAAFSMNPSWSPGYTVPTWAKWESGEIAGYQGRLYENDFEIGPVEDDEQKDVPLSDLGWACEQCHSSLPVDPDYSYEAGAHTIFGTMCRVCGFDNMEAY